MYRKGSCRFILLMALAALCWGCEKNIPEPSAREPRALNAEERAFVDHSNRFAFSFLSKLLEDNPHHNLFFSPLGIGMSLGMVYNGIDNAVKKRIDSMMNFNGSAMQVNKTFNELAALIKTIDDNALISFGNSFWHSRDRVLNDRFKDLIMAYYRAEVEGLNFQSSHAPAYIRRVVNDQISARFESLELSIPASCEALLINATGFSGKWATPVSELIAGIPFNGKKSVRPFEFSKNAVVGYYEDDLLKVVDIPYSNNRFSMTIAMPLHPDRFSFSDFDSDALSDYLRLCETYRADLALPQIGSGYKIDLQKLFQWYNIALIPETRDGESCMFHNPAPRKIDAALHESYIAPFYDIDGTPTVDFNANLLDSDHLILIDRPFVYFIREKHTGMILFAGKFISSDN